MQLVYVHRVNLTVQNIKTKIYSQYDKRIFLDYTLDLLLEDSEGEKETINCIGQIGLKKVENDWKVDKDSLIILRKTIPNYVYKKYNDLM